MQVYGTLTFEMSENNARNAFKKSQSSYLQVATFARVEKA